MLEKYKVSNVEEITPELIKALIDRYTMNEVPRIKKLKEYYLGKTKVKKRTMSDTSKPNNKISNPFASYITDSVVGYWLGKPILYKSDDDVLMEKIQYIFNSNHEANHNNKMAKSITIAGVGYELLYINENNDIKIKELEAENVFIIYENTVEERPLMAVRFYNTENYLTSEVSTNVEIYTDYYSQEGVVIGDTIAFNEIEEHHFKKIPIIKYKNNDECTGSFEKVIDLIDSYDLAVSDTSNNLEYFADAYLVLSGMMDTDKEDIEDMKTSRVMVLEEGGKAEWLVKGSANVEVEAFKDRLKEDIFTLSQVPNLTDDSFGTASSGVSLQYKLFGLENIVSITERNFTSGLEKRIELITNILNLHGSNHECTDIAMNYARNIPANITNLADVISKLHGIVSDETLLSLLPFIDSPANELGRIEKQNEDGLWDSVFNKESEVDKEVEESEELKEIA